ncbi:hypothetical protein ABFO19_19975 [Xanthomonas citri pv. glycines]|uniref:hypothetical protein n=2 Tax=Xanthomonas TaxID=338 RepID=UPI00044CA3CD|nr:MULTISPECIES: hypothetical protein [Xanthomonas]ARV24837.1 hypothetical protein A9D66_20080 [Xanthomonas citri pv. glycines str. 12-2]EWC50779.1 hypothetical protein XAR_3209 [Xanthomonas citri pv. glycines str. 8ra]
MNSNQVASGDPATNAGEALPILSRLEQARMKFEDASQALRDGLSRKSAMKERAATMARARDAAEAEATAARQQWSALLRDADGVLTRDVQKLRAAERSALTLVEEYVLMQQEIQSLLAVVEIEVAELAEKSIDLHDAVVRLASGEAFSLMMAQSGDAIATAFVLFRRAENARVLARSRLSDDELRSMFLHQLGANLDAHMQAAEDSAKGIIGVPALELGGVDMELARSPARRSHLRQEMAMSKIA